MKNLKLLNKNFYIFLIIICLFISNSLTSTETIDIWSLEKKENNTVRQENSEQDDKSLKKSLYDKIKNKDNNIELSVFDSEQLEDKVLLAGLYDPQENNLNIDMWTNSDGEKIRLLLKKINRLNLSNDANDILDIVLLTNSYFPKENINNNEFLKFKFDYLIKKKNLQLIKEFIINNLELNNDRLIIHYVNEYLSNSDLNSACEIFNEVYNIEDDYLIKFKIYCLINANKREEAQLLFDLKKELGLSDPFFEGKFNIIMGYNKNDEKLFSEKNILDFHISHVSDESFDYKPNEKTNKIIWKYLSSANLLDDIENVNLEDIDKIKIIEKATHNKNYSEDDLLNLYKRFQFNINQLINAKEIFKTLPSYEGRALLYQKLLLSSDVSEILDLSSLIKKSLSSENLENAFKEKLADILNEINLESVPSNYTSFYKNNLKPKDEKKENKINNKFIHQSKLLKYFMNKTSLDKVEKETNDLLKKIKKNKKYVFTTKDIILLESLKSDGVNISNKYKNLYKFVPSVPSDLLAMVSNGESGLALLRIVEIIGEDRLSALGTETLNFVVYILNKLDVDNIRNKILLEVLPLKV